jgi:hypothetical protein
MSGYTGFNHAALTDAKLTLLSKPFTKDNLLSKLQEVLGFSAQLETV